MHSVYSILCKWSYRLYISCMEIEYPGGNNENGGSQGGSNVQVVVRIRPLIAREVALQDEVSVQVRQEHTVDMGKRAFRFDRVFGIDSTQEGLYDYCGAPLVDQIYQGYNATILAYGQTGSGKTYTMGIGGDRNSQGVLPRVIQYMYQKQQELLAKVEVIIKVSFLEIYNEEIFDLLDYEARRNHASSANIGIREERDGSISVYGAQEVKVKNYEEMMNALLQGVHSRATSATLMNDSSSRSHAIFTISVEQHFVADLYKAEESEQPDSQPLQSQQDSPEETNLEGSVEKEDNFNQDGFMSAKFHFVDLAGSECIKKTGAVGNVLKEGININKGLLVLGRVIAALSSKQDKKGQYVHVPYRESKLTRILQDSLGGNSKTIMIACMSPAGSNQEESLNTLKYASRARKIQNTPTVNRDPQTILVTQLRQEVALLRKELGVYKGGGEVNVVSNEELRQLKVTLQREKALFREAAVELGQLRENESDYEMRIMQYQEDIDVLKVENADLMGIIKENGLEEKLEELGKETKDTKQLLEEKNKQIEELTKNLQGYQLQVLQKQKQVDQLVEQAEEDAVVLEEQKRLIQELNDQLIAEEVEEDNGQGSQYREIERAIKLKEEEIRNMNKQQLHMKEKLMKEMKNQYYSKIMVLEKEIKKANVLKEDKQQISRANDQYKQRVAEMETRLKELRQKELQQNRLKGQLDQQNRLVSGQQEQLIRFKDQKLELIKKLKEEGVKFAQFRQKKQSEIMGMKKDQQVTTRLVKKLEIQNNMQQIKIDKQNLQIKGKNKSQGIIQRILQANGSRRMPNRLRHSSMQLNASQFIQDASQTQIENTLETIVVGLVSRVTNEKKLESLESILGQVNSKIQSLYANYSAQNLKRDHLESQGANSADIQAQMHATQEQIHDSEEKQEKLRREIQEALKECEQSQRWQQEEELLGKKKRELQVITRLLLQKYTGLCEEYLEQVERGKRQALTLEGKNTQIDQLNQKIQDSYQQRIQEQMEADKLFKQFQQENHNQLQESQFQINQVRQQMKNQQAYYQQQLNGHSSPTLSLNLPNNKVAPSGHNFSSVLDREQQNQQQQQQLDLQRQQHNYQKRQSQLSPREEQGATLHKTSLPATSELDRLQMEVDSLPKFQLKEEEKKERPQRYSFQEQSVMSPKQPLRSSLATEENEANQQEISSRQQHKQFIDQKIREYSSEKREEEEGQSQQNCSLQDIRILNLKERRQRRRNKLSSEEVGENCSWQVEQIPMDYAVLKVKRADHQLLVGCAKGLKIFSLENRKLLFDLSYFNQQVKSIQVNRERNVIIASGDKHISLWDKNNLRIITSFKNNNFEVKDTLMIGDNLFCATTKGLQIYSMRTMNFSNTQHLDRHQDIFSLETDEKVLYYSCRDHVVRALGLHSLDNLPTLQPMHYDAVTTVCRLSCSGQGYLVSGSRDKNLRLWQVHDYATQYSHQVKCSDDWVTTLEKRRGQEGEPAESFYSGSKDGVIKLWDIQNHKLNEQEKVMQLPGQVNSLEYFQWGGKEVLLSGCQDKVIRMMHR